MLKWDIDPNAGVVEIAVERRLDNGGFATLTTIPVHAEEEVSSQSRHQYTDNVSKVANTVYYRLNMLLSDGQRKISDIRLIQLAPNAEVSIYPNPARGNLFVSVPIAMGIADIIMADLSGKIIRQWNGVAQQTLNLDQFRPGVYIMKIKPQNGFKEITRKIVVY
jgi:hypothetical protein